MQKPLWAGTVSFENELVPLNGYVVVNSKALWRYWLGDSLRGRGSKLNKELVQQFPKVHFLETRLYLKNWLIEQKLKAVWVEKKSLNGSQTESELLIYSVNIALDHLGWPQIMATEWVIIYRLLL